MAYYTSNAYGQYGAVRGGATIHSVTTTDDKVIIIAQGFAETYYNASYGFRVDIRIECPNGTSLNSTWGRGVSSYSNDWNYVAISDRFTTNIPRGPVAKTAYVKVIAYGTTVDGYGPYSGNTGWQTVYSITIPALATASTFSTPATIIAGDNLLVSISRGNAAYTHKVELSFGTKNITRTGVTTSTTIPIPIDWLSEIPNAANGPATISVTTYNGNTQVGNVISKTISISVGIDAYPIVSERSLTKINNAVPSEWDVYVQQLSGIKIISPKPLGLYGASITKMTISGAGKTISNDGSESLTLQLDSINQFGEIVFTTSVTDSRGITTIESDSIFVVEYQVPAITKSLAQRCDATGNLNTAGLYAKITLDFIYSSIDGLNDVSTIIRYKQTGASSWLGPGVIGPTVSGGSKIFGGSLDVDKTYDILVEISDSAGGIQYSEDFVSIADPILDILPGGLGIAIGKISELIGVDIKWPVIFRDSVKFGLSSIVSILSDGLKISSGSTDIQLTTSELKIQANSILLETEHYSGVIADWPVAYGKYVMWDWVKYASGKATAHAIVTIRSVTFSNGALPIVYSSPINFSIPPIFSEIPTVCISIEKLGHLITYSINSLTKTAISLYLEKFNNASVAEGVRVHFQVEGWWKDDE